MKVISWNIAGGRPINSNGLFDYQKENIKYFADEIEKLSPDIVCLQETHINNERSVSRELAELLSFKHLFDLSANHQSHIDSDYQLGMAILSKYPIMEQQQIQYPDAWFDLFWADGRKVTAPPHHKYLQIAKVDNFYVANTQLLPIHIFGSNYTKGEGATLANKIDDIITENLKEPLIFCGDFNFDNPSMILPKLFAKFHLSNALPATPTEPAGTKPDHILYSEQFKTVSADVIPTQSDHFLCFAELDYK